MKKNPEIDPFKSKRHIFKIKICTIHLFSFFWWWGQVFFFILVFLLFFPLFFILIFFYIFFCILFRILFCIPPFFYLIFFLRLFSLYLLLPHTFFLYQPLNMFPNIQIQISDIHCGCKKKHWIRKRCVGLIVGVCSFFCRVDCFSVDDLDY